MEADNEKGKNYMESVFGNHYNYNGNVNFNSCFCKEFLTSTMTYFLFKCKRGKLYDCSGCPENGDRVGWRR